MVAAFLATSVFAASPVGAQITRVTVRVDGLSCPFCAYSLEKKIKAVEGTKEPVINVEEGTKIRVTGRLKSPRDVVFGLTTHHPKGGFA